MYEVFAKVNLFWGVADKRFCDKLEEGRRCFIGKRDASGHASGGAIFIV